jgi:type IV pilus assembly protein PilQ
VSASFEDAAKKRRDALIASFPLEPLEVVLMPLSYAKAGSVSAIVKTVLSKRGTAVVDERTNTLVVKDVAQNLAAAQQLILSLDAQTPQVLIEARIVETNDQFTRQFGIQWGGDFLSASTNGNPTGLVFPSTVGVAGAATDGQTPLAGIIGAPNFAVNMPAAIGTGSGGGIGVTLGSIGGAGNLALRLSALEREGHIKIVSAPRIMTLDNTSATISTGTQIPVAVVSAAGAQTTFVEANLQLTVTPSVTQDGNIILQLNISKSEPDFANTGAAGDPSIITRDAQTELMVGDGDTTVIGGIFAHTTATGTNKVPFLADIPILGFFFRDYSEDENRNELLIFVTPRIVNREAALDSRRLNPIDSPDIFGAE